MKYIIELGCPRYGTDHNTHWERSWAYPDEYTRDEAKELINDPCNKYYKWRIVSLTPKPYRRHAAVTPLELRGAKQMLTNAIKHIVQSARASNCEPCNANYFAPYRILSDALVAVMRHLETL